MEKSAISPKDRKAASLGKQTSPTENSYWGGMLLPSSSPTENGCKTHTQQPHIGNISPRRCPVDPSLGSSSTNTTTTTNATTCSASSSCTDSWSVGYVDNDEENDEYTWDNRGSARSEEFSAAKIEPLDDDIKLGDVMAAPSSSELSNGILHGLETGHRRPRGRPRKIVPGPVAAENKVAKVRSKTGCITCRKRKKKCDEARPRCRCAAHVTLTCVTRSYNDTDL